MKNNFKQFLDGFTSENNLNPTETNHILSNALIDAWKISFGDGYDLFVEINSFGISLYRFVTTVEKVINNKIEINGLPVGERKKEKISLDLFDRNFVSLFQSCIGKYLKTYKKEEEYNTYLPQVGKLFVCSFLYYNGLDSIIKVSGSSDGVISRYFSVNEVFKRGERFKALLYEVKKNTDGHQLFFDRKTHTFIVELLKDHIPEIKNDQMQILKIVRHPNSLCKVLIKSDFGIGACFGQSGNRRKDIINELRGEKVDFVLYHPLIEQQIKNAFSRIKILSIDIQDENINVVIPDENMKNALGRKGQNISMINKLIDTNIKIISETEFNQNQNIYQNTQITKLTNAGVTLELATSLIKQYKDIIEIPENRRDENIQSVYNELFQELKLEFINKGGDAKLFGISTLVPIKTYFTLQKYQLDSIAKISQYKDPNIFSKDAHIEFHLAIFLLESVRKFLENVNQ